MDTIIESSKDFLHVQHHMFRTTEFCLPIDITLEKFNSFLFEFGFKEVPRIKVIFNNLVNRADNNRACFISDGTLSICFHQGNESAFPLPKKPYSPVLIETYRRLNRQILDDCFQPLVELNPQRFGTRVSDILLRRDMFLKNAVSPV
jgi:hypothetical protein